MSALHTISKVLVEVTNGSEPERPLIRIVASTEGGLGDPVRVWLTRSRVLSIANALKQDGKNPVFFHPDKDSSIRLDPVAGALWESAPALGVSTMTIKNGKRSVVTQFTEAQRDVFIAMLEAALLSNDELKAKVVKEQAQAMEAEKAVVAARMPTTQVSSITNDQGLSGEEIAKFTASMRKDSIVRAKVNSEGIIVEITATFDPATSIPVSTLRGF